jgi:hypothetical protein
MPGPDPQMLKDSPVERVTVTIEYTLKEGVDFPVFPEEMTQVYEMSPPDFHLSESRGVARLHSPEGEVFQLIPCPDTFLVIHGTVRGTQPPHGPVIDDLWRLARLGAKVEGDASVNQTVEDATESS